MSKFKVGDNIIWTGALLDESTRWATIKEIKDQHYHYTFCNGTDYAYSVIDLDSYSGVRLLSPLEQLL